jgi:hypothetical protein
LFSKWVQKKVLWKNCKDNLEKNDRTWEKNKINKENSRYLQIFCLCNLGFEKEVRHFLLLFILLFPLKDLFRYLSLKKLLKRLEKTKDITGKLWKDIILGSPKERQVLVSKLIPFPFLILKKEAKGQFATRTRSATTSRKAYLGSNSRKNPHS